MRGFLLIKVLLSCFLVSSQKNPNQVISCESIRGQFVDSTLYTQMGGKLIFTPNKTKDEIFKIIVDKNQFYYVSKTTLRQMKEFIRNNECNDIKVEPIDLKRPSGKNKRK